jgi:GNAT superfamily N-acetyltransferase
MRTSDPLVFQKYEPGDYAACLALFDANCPEFFAPNERADYRGFLDSSPGWYELSVVAGNLVGAFGLDPAQSALRWIMIHPDAQGHGIGSAIMKHVVDSARKAGVSSIAIAASQKSAPFFGKFGAVERSIHENGWGPGLDRIDMTLAIDTYHNEFVSRGSRP